MRYTLIALLVLVSIAHTMAFEDEQIEAQSSVQSCSTDSECGCLLDCLEPASEPVIADTLPMMIKEGE